MRMGTLFRWVGILEGLSFVALLGVAMPMKYAGGVQEATRVPGMLHGLLFVAYVALALQRSDEENWPRRRLMLAFVASVLPFGTFLFDRKFLRDNQADQMLT